MDPRFCSISNLDRTKPGIPNFYNLDKTDLVELEQKIGIVFNKPVQKISCGSSLKICLLASGEIDVYPRFANNVNR